MNEFTNKLPEELLPQWQYEDEAPEPIGLKWEKYASIPERKRQEPWAGITESYMQEISAFSGIGVTSSSDSYTSSTRINLNQLSTVGASRYDVIQMTDNGWQVQKFKLEQ